MNREAECCDPRGFVFAGDSFSLASCLERHYLWLVADVDFDRLVEEYYMPLFRFGLSLSRKESDAVDLTQQTFLIWAEKGHQLRDPARVKTWLFTTLYRQFLAEKRRAANFAGTEEEVEFVEPPHFSPSIANAIDAGIVQKRCTIWKIATARR